MKIYLAARYSRQAELRGYAEQLRAAGHTITSRWLSPEDESAYRDLSPEGRRKCAEHDIEDVRAADLVISFTEQPDIPTTTRGGRHVEMGIAIGLGKSLYGVGPREHVFHWLPYMAWFENFETCLESLKNDQSFK